ncbi:MAG: cell division protein FtsZ [Sphingomonadales bacterium]|jgi:cell division protein FtsZ|nr:cell division protein FtsZ [Sphingomonadales bacterium]MEA3045044.1 cell division protein FtsZ [Sphingomonadales bacterium]
MIEYLGELKELHPRIAVIGVGGAGGNAVANMMGSNVKGVTFIAANTDAQALQANSASRVLQLGRKATEGLGAGSRAEVGRAAAEESLAEIDEMLAGAHMCFIAAGLGGGTGTGAAPVIAKAARAKGILTVGVVTKPFAFEGKRRAEVAERGLVELQQHVDTLIVIPNQNLFRIANAATTFKAAFDLADEVLQQGVRGITDLMVTPGLINLDFADIRTIMANKGKAMMGTGEATGDDRAIRAAEAAISNPLLDEAMKGARGLIISVSGGDDLLLMEVDEIAGYIQKLVDPEADIIWGSAFDSALAGRVRVSVVATGIDTPAAAPAIAPAPCEVPAQAGLPLEMPRPGPETRLERADRDELLLTVAQALVLTPPEHAVPLETVEPFAEAIRGPSLFERMASIAHGASPHGREELRQAA